MMTEDELRGWLAEGKTIWQVMEIARCSRNTVRNYLTRFGLQSPPGFFRREGKKIGRPAGFTHTPEHRAIMSERFRGENNPFFGKNHAPETIAKMSRPRPGIQGDKNPFRRACLASPACREASRERARQRWAGYSPEQRNAIHQRFIEARSRNTYHRDHATFKNHQHGFHESPKAGRIFYRSAWERTLARFMDECPLVTSYQSEPYTVPYQDKQGLMRRTTPDFLVCLASGQRLLIEVKPAALLDHYNNRERLAGQRRFCRANGLQHALVTGPVVRDEGALNALFQAADQGERYVNNADGSK